MLQQPPPGVPHSIPQLNWPPSQGARLVFAHSHSTPLSLTLMQVSPARQ